MSVRNDVKFGTGMPEVYQRCLVPVLFGPYADRLEPLVAAARPERILELAAGTGVLTRKLAAALPLARITATDLAPPMVLHAAGEPLVNVQYEQADAMHLRYPDETFDAVACQFGVMFFGDRVAAYRQALRVLTPGGQFVFSTWESGETNPHSDAMHDVLAESFPTDPPDFLSRVPHGYHDVELIRSELEVAGFELVSITRVAMLGGAATARQLAVGFCTGTPLRTEIECRGPDRLAETVDLIERAFLDRFGSGPIRIPIAARFVVAQRPLVRMPVLDPTGHA